MNGDSSYRHGKSGVGAISSSVVGVATFNLARRARADGRARDAVSIRGARSTSVADVAANLLFIPPAREVADPHRRPAQLRHQLRQTPECPRCALALRHLEHV